jgi:beta-galactosidase
MFNISRRQFLLSASSLATGALFPAPLRAVAMTSSLGDASEPMPARRLDAGWEYRRNSLDGIWEVWRDEESPLWTPVSLPHCFNDKDACDPDQPYYRGDGWYRTRLVLENPFPHGRTLLHFQGAGQTSTVWIGSVSVGTHKGGYDEFVFDITDALQQLPPEQAKGGTPVAILCSNGPDLERVPSDLSDFCLYGGLYRHVNLVYLPALALDAIHILPTVRLSALSGSGTPSASAQVTVRARLYNPGQASVSSTVFVEVLDPSGKSIHTSRRTLAAWGGMIEIAAFAVADAELWSPDTPRLYHCRVTLTTAAGQTTLVERFGLRHTEFVEHGPFKLNGTRLLLRGTQRHADHAGLAAAMTDDLVRQEMQLIREMGANFIRLGHYQQDRLVLDLCDELGLMVWEEAPWCRAGIGDRAFQDNAKDMLRHMIDQHFNHPSIILWGLGNEDDWPDEFPAVDQAAIRAFMTEMRDLAHSLDGSRLTSFRRCDFARDIPDVYSPSIWAGWYRGNYREYEASLEKERGRVKHMLHAEWGADSLAGRHSEDPEAILRKVATGVGTDERGLDYLKTGGDVRVSKDGDWSETYACNLFDWYLKTQEKLDWLTGSAQWIFKDFASPLRTDDPIPNMNQKGVVQRDLIRKEGYYVFQSYWSDKPMVHLYGHTWPIRWGQSGEQRMVKVYSNCEHAELFLNGRSMGRKQRDSQDFPAAGLRWNVAFASGPNHLRVEAERAGVKLADELDLTYQTEAWGDPAELRLREIRREGHQVTVEATLYDAKGVLCLDSRKPVRFSLAGAGMLIDNLGTAHGSRAVQFANGRCSISVAQLPNQTGACMVGVVAEDIAPAFLLLKAGSRASSELEPDARPGTAEGLAHDES